MIQKRCRLHFSTYTENMVKLIRYFIYFHAVATQTFKDQNKSNSACKISNTACTQT